MVEVHFAAVHSTAAGSYPAEILDHWSPRPNQSRRRRMLDALVGGQELFVVAESASRVIGFGVVVPALSELKAVYVDPSFGRLGVGAKIVSHLERLAVENGALELHLSASINAEQFYLRAGYQSVERTMHQLSGGPQMACVAMRKAMDISS